MAIAQLSGGTTFTGLPCWSSPKTSRASLKTRIAFSNYSGHYKQSSSLRLRLPLPILGQRKQLFSNPNNRLNPIACSFRPCDDAEETLIVQDEQNKSDKLRAELEEINGNGASDSIGIVDKVVQPKNIKRELVTLSLPAMAGQAIDPLTQLMETAYIGRLGSVELASAGVSMTIFNNISKLFNIPLLSVATSFVAEDISKNARKPVNGVTQRQQLSSVSTALLLAVGIGMFEALALSLASGFLLNIMGISSASPMRGPAQRFLILRAIGAPAFVVSLALQGVFRGFKDTKTPVYCLAFGNFTAIILFPLFMYYFGLGVNGAAISSVMSQYIVAFSMIWQLNKIAVLMPPKLGDLQFGTYLKSGGFLIGRTLSVLLTMTLAASMAARQGPVAMAAYQITFQLWLAASLLTDAPAAAAQSLIASYMSKGDYTSVREITYFVLKIGLGIGLSLAVLLGMSFGPVASVFSKDTQVLRVVKTGLLFVCVTQPINSLAFIFDGLHYGVSDFPYAARSMMLVGAISSAFMLFSPKLFGLPGIWSGLTLFMTLRTMAGFFRILSKDSPWWFLHDDVYRPKETSYM